MSFDNWEWPLAFSSLTEQSESGNRCIELFVDEQTFRLVICCEHFRSPKPFRPSFHKFSCPIARHFDTSVASIGRFSVKDR